MTEMAPNVGEHEGSIPSFVICPPRAQGKTE